MQAKELKIYKGSGRNYTPVPQIIIQGNRLIVEKCKDGHDAEEAAMVR